MYYIYMSIYSMCMYRHIITLHMYKMCIQRKIIWQVSGLSSATTVWNSWGVWDGGNG